MNTLDFIKTWKTIINDKRIKPTFILDSYDKKIKVKGFIYPEHHLIYNIIRGFELNRGFIFNSEGYKEALVNLNYYLNDLASGYERNKTHRIFTPFIGLIDFYEFKDYLLSKDALIKKHLSR
jgi:hypothetical protein